METLQAIQTRRAVRRFLEKKVPQDLTDKILEAGRFSPSPLNSQPWKFIVVRKKETLQKLAQYALHGVHLSSADTVIVTVVERHAGIDVWLEDHKQHLYAGAVAMENMWLASTDMGIGACWVTLDEKKTKDILHISEKYELIGGLALGYPETPPEPHGEGDRKSLSELISYEEFSSWR
ncbi:MAG TPA: nitroreductase family protein [Patescibacteria group bacterium]|nr:nitroreductase family protein [Patescibacteria group bacterium]